MLEAFPRPFAEPQPFGAPAAEDDGMFEASQDCVKVLSLAGELMAMNANGRCLMEIDNFEAVRGQVWASLWPEQHRPVLQAAVARASAGGVARFSADCPTAKGTQKWWDVVVSPVFDETGRPARLLSISRDVTEQRRIETERSLLARELAHRIKNMFAVVDGVISLSARGTQSPEAKAFAASVRERLTGLGRAVAYVSPAELIGREDAAAHSLHGLLHVLLAPYGFSEDMAGRVSIAGDDVAVGRAATTSVALFANELATNALKYGALSRPEGRVSVTTKLHDGELELNWAEHGSGAPEPRALASGEGFGTTLMDNAVIRQLSGSLTREWGEDGLLVRIRLPLERLGR